MNELQKRLANETIIKDFLKIREHLGFSEEWALELRFAWTGGYCQREKKRIGIGLKDGYKRWALVHEGLHASGLKHHDVPGFGGCTERDTYSPQVELEIFGQNYPVRRVLI